ncbi:MULTISPECIES: hypothetical protein [Alteromonas]|uniref:Uncharacterized protein n=1 Tax=Alteromonas macleodii TaxID=28108 RepID=A0A6T9XVS5_ALTMA|nr:MULTISPECIES: hypothetical protein [Alteromonas]OLF77545.1 hypothetical protein AWH61_19730 [Alteromonas sp. W12]CAB9492585.1 protein of unknown function [Alteromonas macleodii]|tara:strand:- start:64 stop:396 length:333 start_codon:yes stop_codon:yes gene_type:complete
MNKMTKFFGKHYDFIKWQSECYALSVGFFTVSILCFKYLEQLVYVLGIISGVFLGLIGLGLTLAAIDKAQTYIGDKIAIKGSPLYMFWGLVYVSTAVCTGFALTLKVVSE